MQVGLNPHHTRVGSTGRGHDVKTNSGQACGVYDTPAVFGGTEAGMVTLYADKMWLVLTPAEARDLAEMLLKHARAIEEVIA